MNGSNMNNRNYEKYLIEYPDGRNFWTAAEARTEQEAFELLETHKSERVE